MRPFQTSSLVKNSQIIVKILNLEYLSEDRECMEGWCGGLVAKDGHQGSYVAPMEPIWRYARTECKECLECVAGNIQCLECRGWVAIYQLSQGWARPERQKDVAPARVALYQISTMLVASFQRIPLKISKNIIFNFNL